MTTLKKNMRLVVKNAELAGVYAFILVLTGLFFGISWAILHGQKISLNEIGDFSSLVYVFIASFFVGLLFFSKIPNFVHKLEVLFGGLLYLSIFSLPVSSIIRDHSISNILKSFGIIAFLIFFIFDIDIKPKRPSQYHAKLPQGYNPT
ncbi:hypothetical protein JCM16307_07700 [Thermococcus prieurii]